MIGRWRSPANLADYVTAALAADGDDAALHRLMAEMAAEYGITHESEAGGRWPPTGCWPICAALSDAAPARPRRAASPARGGTQ